SLRPGRTVRNRDLQLGALSLTRIRPAPPWVAACSRTRPEAPMIKLESTTVLLRPAPEWTRDLWDEVLRVSRRVEHTPTRALVRRSAHWAVPAAVTAAIATIGLSRPGLWTDELATWGMATAPWSELWPVLRYVDAVLAPYYVFMHLWVSV